MLLPKETPESYPLTVVKDKFSALTARANETDCPFVVLKGGKPWVEVRPLAVKRGTSPDGIVIEPVRRQVKIADVGALFAEYDSAGARGKQPDSVWGERPQVLGAGSGQAPAESGSFVPVEDGFAGPVGKEEL